MRLLLALPLILSLGLPLQAGAFGRFEAVGTQGLRLDTPFIPPGRDARESGGNHGGRLTAGEAAQRAQKQNGGGRVLSVQPAGDGYRVKLLRNGEVRVVYVH